ncbi:MAG: quinone-dependent dihydroorotate dehydrogenase [Anaerolineales bacterium]
MNDGTWTNDLAQGKRRIVMYSVFRPLLFKMDPERAHSRILGLVGMVGGLAPLRELLRRIYLPASSRPVEIAGLVFPNPVGLAAGYDKDCTAWRGLSCLGFGHLELGTVTPRPQAGNPRPRIFRYPGRQAIINRMGFPGRGAEFAKDRIPPRGSSPVRDRIVLGVNIGKNKDTSNERAVEDYLACLRSFLDRADYLAVNVSSPNTLGLRQLQGKAYLRDLLGTLVAERDQLAADLEQPPPLFVKLSPDLTDHELDGALEAILESSADGVIATNTTIQRGDLMVPDPNQEGGLSGRPLKELSTSLVRKIADRSAGDLPIIAVGGINSVEDAREKLDAGASLVQVYSGLIFQGPGLARELVNHL